jgi:hypothetical protein
VHGGLTLFLALTLTLWSRPTSAFPDQSPSRCGKTTHYLNPPLSPPLKLSSLSELPPLIHPPSLFLTPSHPYIVFSPRCAAHRILLLPRRLRKMIRREQPSSSVVSLVHPFCSTNKIVINVSTSAAPKVDSITHETAEIITPNEPCDTLVRTPVGSDPREVQAGMLNDSGATDAAFTDHLASAANASTTHVADGNPMLLGDRHQESSGIHTCKFNRSNNLRFFVANPQCLLSLRARRWYRRMQRGCWQWSPAG